MPAYLFGETCTIATTRLHRLGVTATCPPAKAIASDRIATGEVARIIYGTTSNPVAVPKGSSVILELSTGPGPSSGTTTTTTTPTTPTTTTTLAGQGVRAVPNVVGMDQAQVIAAMKKAVLYFTTTGPGAGTTKWTTVISQSPAAGTLVPYKSSVLLHVGE
jgi:beta-lactam-binding protein with PASTA domain